MRRLLWVGLLMLSGCPEPSGSEGIVAPDAAVTTRGPTTLEQPAEIRYDSLGVPHIYAGSDEDAFLVAGYAQARDRLFQIDVNRRAATGRLAEVFGPDRYSGDVQAHTLGYLDLATRSLAIVEAERPADYDLIVAFAAGINRQVDAVLAGTAPLPEGYRTLGFEPQPFTPAELLAIGVRIQFGFSQTLEPDLLNTVVARFAGAAEGLAIHAPAADAFIMVSDPARGGPVEKRGGAGPVPSDAELRALREGIRRFQRDLDVGQGSNCWAVAGRTTADGRPMLANDSHAGYNSPNSMYLNHIDSARAGGAFDTVGMSFVGVPGVHVGHNRDIAWGATTHFADVTDLWDVALDDDAVSFGGRRLPVERSEVVVAVKGEADRTLSIVRVPGVGVILPEEMLPVPASLLSEGAVLLGWPGFEPNTDYYAFADVDRARSLAEFRDAIGQMSTGMQNWQAISSEGLTYLSRGLVPDRGPPPRPAPNVILDGDDPATAWTGEYLDFADLPSIEGDRPFVGTANNDPWGHTADNDPNNDAFYYGSFYAPGFRAGTLARELGRLVAAGGITRTDMQALQLDVFSPAADELLEHLGFATVGAELAPEVAAAWQTLSDWDRRMTRDSKAALLYRYWVEFLARRVLADDLPLLYEALAEAQPVFVVKLTVRALRDEAAALLDGPAADHLLGALADAAAAVAERGDPTWGDVHRARFRKPQGGSVTFAIPGGDSALNVAQSRCGSEGVLAELCETTGGAVYRHVFTLTADGQPQLWGNWPENNAGTTRDWIEGVFRRVPFTRAEVEAQTVRILRLPAD